MKWLKDSSLVSIFEKLKRASSEWFHLTERPADKQRVSRDYSKDVFRMELFENKYKEWLDRVYTPKRQELYGKGTANISRIDLNLKLPVVSSVERRQKLQNVNTEASHVTNISEVLGVRTSNVIKNPLFMIWRQIKCVQEKKAFHKVVNCAQGMSSVHWPS